MNGSYSRMRQFPRRKNDWMLDDTITALCHRNFLHHRKSVGELIHNVQWLFEEETVEDENCFSPRWKMID